MRLKIVMVVRQSREKSVPHSYMVRHGLILFSLPHALIATTKKTNENSAHYLDNYFYVSEKQSFCLLNVPAGHHVLPSPLNYLKKVEYFIVPPF